MELTRRWFLIGSATALAAAALPTEAITVTPLQAVCGYKRRHITEIGIFNEEERISLRILVRGATLLEAAVQPKWCFRWVATPESEIVLLPKDTLCLATTGGRQSLIALICQDYVDEGPPISLIESYRYPFTSPASVDFLNADNSLEARLKRVEAVPLVEDWDYDD